MVGKTKAFYTKNDMLYSLLKDNLLSGAYHPGERLVVADLAAEFQVSPMPVREALQRLQQDGWVEITPHVGARVVTFDREKYLEIIAIRKELEPMAASLAAKRMDDAHVQQLFEIVAEMEACIAEDDTSNYSKLNRQFHNTIYSCCGNGTLLGIINDLIAKSSQSQSIFYRSPKRMQVSTLQHRQIAEAIRSKDFERAQLLMRKHKEEGFQLTVELLENSR